MHTINVIADPGSTAHEHYSQWDEIGNQEWGDERTSRLEMYVKAFMDMTIATDMADGEVGSGLRWREPVPRLGNLFASTYGMITNSTATTWSIFNTTTLS